MDISNGEGIGVALFTQGCHFRCKGCFNSETWDFDKGKEWTKSDEENFFELLSKPYITRASILGGEPLCDENVGAILGIIRKIRHRFPDKSIWLYTGYTLEEIFSKPTSAFNALRQACVVNSDYVISGRFDISRQDLYGKLIKWAGSTNQRVTKVSDGTISKLLFPKQSEEVDTVDKES